MDELQLMAASIRSSFGEGAVQILLILVGLYALLLGSVRAYEAGHDLFSRRTSAELERRQLETLKLRCEIEALRKEHALTLRPDDEALLAPPPAPTPAAAPAPPITTASPPTAGLRRALLGGAVGMQTLAGMVFGAAAPLIVISFLAEEIGDGVGWACLLTGTAVGLPPLLIASTQLHPRAGITSVAGRGFAASGPLSAGFLLGFLGFWILICGFGSCVG